MSSNAPRPRRRLAAVFGLLGLCVGVGPLLTAPEPAVGATSIAVLTGGSQVVMGPTNDADSVYATVSDSRGLHAIVSNNRMMMYDQALNGTLSNGRVALNPGGKGSVDYCGLHPIGAVYRITATHWVTFYHGEKANPYQYNGECYGGPGKRNFTRWAVYQLETWNAGLTWAKGTRVVLGQDSTFLKWSTDRAVARRDDAGSPRLVLHGNYMYLFYRAVNRVTPNTMVMSVARAPLTSLGDPGSWRKYYNGSFSQPGVGGRQSAVKGLPGPARGITWNTYLKSYISVQASEAGIVLYRSEGTNLTKWHFLKQIVGRFTTESAWGKPCVPGKTPDFPVAVGYGATIGWTGSSTSTGQNFWVYYVQKPTGMCFNQRNLMRRQVALNTALKRYPTVTRTTGPINYRTYLSKPRLVKKGHGWVVSTYFTRNVYVPLPGRSVKVQAYARGRWITVKTLTTGAKGGVALTGYSKYPYRFFTSPAGAYSAAATAPFYWRYH